MGTGLENVWHEVCREAVCIVGRGAERRRSRAVECPHPSGYIGTSSTKFETVTLERILEGGNMMRAYRSVCANKGSAGVDGMKTSDLLPFIKSHPHLISESVRTGKYRPSPIRRVYIPKDNGEQRPLGIPTVVDRLIQQATAQVLSDAYEEVFSDNSFGFRPKRSCKDAINRALEYVNDGYDWVIDLDLSKFFDTVNHSKLLQLLSDRIKDGRVISLIHKFLRAPICENGVVGKKTTIGTPQGGCISPVLANILLNELDTLLDSRGIRFVRYADDMVIMCHSKKAAERILSHVKKYVEEKLFLKVNETKTKIVRAGHDTQFLGFAFTQSVAAWRRKEYPLRTLFATVHRKKRDKLIKVLKELLDRRAKGGIERVKVLLRLKLRGWCNYFGEAIPVSWRDRVDQWMRRRIRQLLWKQWKKPENRVREFCKRLRKAPPQGAVAFSSNRYWRMSENWYIHTALSNKQLEREGWSWLSLYS